MGVDKQWLALQLSGLAEALIYMFCDSSIKGSGKPASGRYSIFKLYKVNGG
jgi:hypothetical protein